ncbi:hypothetical protein ACHAQD_012171 [Fusarium lateritium]
MSRRARETFHHGKAWDLMAEVKQRPQYDPQAEPDGVINLSGALNSLMRDWMKDYCENHVDKTQLSKRKLPSLVLTPIVSNRSSIVLSYGSISGGPNLQAAASGFFNEFFNPCVSVQPSQIVATNGVTSMIDLMAWTLCEPGDAVLYPSPTFYMLEYDLASRNGVLGVPVSMLSIEDQFGDSEEGVREMVEILETAANSTCASGHRPRILFICNPSNPQGRCYSKMALNALAAFCGRHDMHLVADEIYALSHFGDEEFSSVLAIDDNPKAGVVTRQMVHQIYGISKDFDMGGLRMGFLVSRNQELLETIKRVTWFTWITAYSETFVTNFYSRLDLVHEYVSTYQMRLSQAYSITCDALIDNKIPFQPATAGLFVLVDLGYWVAYFKGPDEARDPARTREVQLCKWLVDGGVFVNPGQFAYSNHPGHFRLVFTEEPAQTVVLAIQRMRHALEKLEKSRVRACPATPNSHGDYSASSAVNTSSASSTNPSVELEVGFKNDGLDVTSLRQHSYFSRALSWLNCLE